MQIGLKHRTVLKTVRSHVGRIDLQLSPFNNLGTHDLEKQQNIEYYVSTLSSFHSLQQKER